MSSKKWIPEIVYEESESQIPIIHVPPDELDPRLLYIFLARPTGDVEPGTDGEEIPVMQWDLHQYADMAILKENLPLATYDDVRRALGLEDLKDAVKKGLKITDNVKKNLN